MNGFNFNDELIYAGCVNYDISDFILAKFKEGDDYYDQLMSLFEEHEDTVPKLKSLKEVNSIMMKRCPSIDRFRRITERMLQNWYINAFIEPALVSIGYTKPYHEDSSKSHVDDLSPVFDTLCERASTNEKSPTVEDRGDEVVNSGRKKKMLEPLAEKKIQEEHQDGTENIPDNEGFLAQSQEEDDDDEQQDEADRTKGRNNNTENQKISDDEALTPGKRKRTRTKRLIDELLTQDHLDETTSQALKNVHNKKTKPQVFDVQEIGPINLPRKRSNATSNTTTSRGRANKRRQSAGQMNEGRTERAGNLNDNQSSNDSLFSDDTASHQRPTLDTPPTARKKPRTGRKHDTDDEEEEVKSPIKPKRQRVPWSEEEKDAIKEGFKQFGYSWVKIKDAYDDVLHNRTNVQIKVSAPRFVSFVILFNFCASSNQS